MDESSLARRLVHSQLATPGYSDVTEHISFRLGMLFDDLSSSSSGGASGSGSSSSITSSLLSLLPSSIGIPSAGNVNAVGIHPIDDVKVKVQVHGSAALHIVDSRLAVDLSVALTVNHGSENHVNKSQGVEGGVGEGIGDYGDQKLGMEKLASLREAIVSVESLAVLAPALHAEVLSTTTFFPMQPMQDFILYRSFLTSYHSIPRITQLTLSSYYYSVIGCASSFTCNRRKYPTKYRGLPSSVTFSIHFHQPSHRHHHDSFICLDRR